MIQLFFMLLFLGSTFAVESAIQSKRNEAMTIVSDDKNMPDCDENSVYRSRACKRKRCLIIRDSLTVEGSAFINNLNVTNETTGSLIVGGIPFGSLTTYCYAVYTGTQQVIKDVIFTLPILASPDVSTDTPDPSSGLFIEINVPAGTYAFSFQAAGVGATTKTNGLIFTLHNATSNTNIPTTQYISDNLTATGIAVGAFNVRGFGIVTFSSPTAVTLRNNSGQTVNLDQGLPKTPAAITASLTLMRIAS